MSEGRNGIPMGGSDGVLLIARVALAAIFVSSGYAKLTHLGAFTQTLAGHAVPGGTALALGACVEFFGSICILLGSWTAWVALLIAPFTVVAALISHRFWDAEGAARATQNIQFIEERRDRRRLPLPPSRGLRAI